MQGTGQTRGQEYKAFCVVFSKLGCALPGRELVDVAPATAAQRMLKSEEEVEVIKLGAATADIGGAAVAAACVAGVAEWEAAQAGVRAMVGHIAGEAGDRAELMDSWVWLQSGLNTDGAHNPLTSRILQRGDILSINCFPMIQGYYTALERTLFLGSCDDESLKAGL